MVGIVEGALPDGMIAIGVRNRLQTGETVEFISRGMAINRHLLMEMTGENGETLQVAHPNRRIRVRVPFYTEQFDLIRREK